MPFHIFSADRPENGSRLTAVGFYFSAALKKVPKQHGRLVHWAEISLFNPSPFLSGNALNTQTTFWKFSETLKVNTLVLQSILENFESILYLDTDVVIMSNLTEMWENFKAMQRREPQVIAAFSEILPEPAKGLYSEQNRVPFYGHSGEYLRSYIPLLHKASQVRFSEIIPQIRRFECRSDLYESYAYA